VSDSKVKGGLLDQHKLLRAVIQSPWATVLDIKVADAIIQNYFRQHGNSRAALSFLEQATRAKRERITKSVRRLVDHGVLTVFRKGEGTRPTEYVPNFDWALAVPNMGTTSHADDDSLAVPKLGTTAVPKMGTTRDASSPQVGDPNLLTSRSTYREVSEDNKPLPARGFAALAKEESQAFEKLLALYKRPWGDDAALAQTAFTAALAAGHNVQAILTGAQAWVAATEARYLKPLHEFLRDGAFLNEPPSAGKANPQTRTNRNSHGDAMMRVAAARHAARQGR
jgi:hypothetical protein